jgi:hypothetical protein
LEIIWQQEEAAMGRSRSKTNYWLPVFVLVSMCLILLVVVLAAVPEVLNVFSGLSPLESDSPVESEWSSKLNEALSRMGFQLFSTDLISGFDNRPQLEFTVGDKMTNGDTIDPYLLIKGIHMVVYASLTSPDLESPDVDFIMIRVVDSQGDFLYSVLLDMRYFEAVLDQEITEQDYLSSWIVSGNAPDFQLIFP